MEDIERLYSAFFRGEKRDDGIMIRVEADSLAEAARIAEETRDSRGVDPKLRLHLVIHGYGSPRML
jgi:hypothetical protein